MPPRASAADYVNPTIWGPVAWRIFHSLAALPRVKVGDLRNMLNVIAPILPCTTCSIHLQHILTLPVPADQQRSGRLFMFWIHNVVNDQLSKPMLSEIPIYLTPLQAPEAFDKDLEFLLTAIRETHKSDFAKQSLRDFKKIVSAIIKGKSKPM